MRRILLLSSLLLLVLAWFGWLALRETPVTSISAPRAEPEWTNDVGELDPVLPASRDAAAENEAEPDSALSARAVLAASGTLRGVLRDKHTGKPIPEVRVALSQGDQREVLRTDLDGKFRSASAVFAGSVTIDPTPFADDVADWYSRANGTRLAIEFDPRNEVEIEVLVAAPAFVIIEGAESLREVGEQVEADLLLPGAERTGPNRTTWVRTENRQRGYHPHWLSDGSLLVSPAPFDLKREDPSLIGTGDAHIEVRPRKASCRWFSTDSLTLSNTHIRDLRVRARERSMSAEVSVRVTDARDRPLESVTRQLFARAATLRIDEPAARRRFPEWSVRPSDGDPLAFGRTNQLGVWDSVCLPAGEYDLVALHELYNRHVTRLTVAPEKNVVASLKLSRAPLGAPIRLHVRWEDERAPRPSLDWRFVRLADDLGPFDPKYSGSRLGPNSSGKLDAHAASAVVVCTDLPAGRYRLELNATSWSGSYCLPAVVTPTSPQVSSGDDLEVLVHNVDYVQWRIELPAELVVEGETRKSWSSLELYDADGTKVGFIQLHLAEGSRETVAPRGTSWSYVLPHGGSDEAARETKGPWLADHVELGGAFECHVLIVR